MHINTTHKNLNVLFLLNAYIILKQINNIKCLMYDLAKRIGAYGFLLKITCNNENMQLTTVKQKCND